MTTKVQNQYLMMMFIANVAFALFWMIPLYMQPASLERYAWEEWRVIIVGGLIVFADMLGWIIVSRRKNP